VGSEVADAVLDSVPNAQQTLETLESGKFLFNLWEANRQILLDNGYFK
jgi:copper oxidase (laccase) domain-containing protein